MTHNTMDLIEHYHEFFYITAANTPELLEQAFKLRYEVFIEECGFSYNNSYPLNKMEPSKHIGLDKIEKDSYDKQSHHCLLFHKPTNKPIGYVRLIPYCENNGVVLPLETYGINFYQSIIRKLRSPGTGEISRLTIHPLFRRRLSDQLYHLYEEESTDNKRYRINYLPVCLIVASLSLMFDYKMEYTVALMEKNLLFLLKRNGVVYKQIGPLAEFKGIKLVKKAPYSIIRQQTYDNLNPDFKELFAIIRDELTPSETTVVDVEE